MPESAAVRLHQGLVPLLKEVGEVPPGPFIPARFQVEALEAVLRGDVFVSAPTGSGKTWIAERAMEQVLARGGTAWDTTEILRNALYDGGVTPDLAVLDEAHYLGDPERGMAWEEIIMLAPAVTHLLLLSATLQI